MQIKPNSSRLRAEVLAVRRLSEQRTCEIEIRVLENHSEPGLDFIQAAKGQVLTLQGHEDAQTIAPHDVVDVEAEQRGGPFGQRLVYRSIRKLAQR
jgi:hypothetical protein